jgi:PBSX family phage terminase large subunit
MIGPLTRPVATFIPKPWQVAPWRDTSPTALLTGSAGGGKSRLAVEKVHGFCKKYPRAQGLVLRKTRESMGNSTVIFLERVVIGADPSVRHVPSKLPFEYAIGSVLTYGGMANDEQREQIRSVGQEGGVDIAWMDEANAFAEDDFNEVPARMRGQAAPWRQVILSTNPDAPDHWINTRLIQGGEATVYYSNARDNDSNPPEYRASLEKLTGTLKERLVKGL